MSIATEINRIQSAATKIKEKAVELKISGNTEKIDGVANAISNITNIGTVTASIGLGETYIIQAGYYSGGTVTATDGTTEHLLQSKSISPSRKEQTVTADKGFYGLSSVTVGAIPDYLQDVTSVNVTPDDVLMNKTYVDINGIHAGTMTNNAAETKVLTAATQSYSIPSGYHNGKGLIKIVVEEKKVTPTKSIQTITPTEGKVLGKVEVGAIPNEYVNTSDSNATYADILENKTAYVNGSKVTGSMPNNGSIINEIDGLSTTSVTIPAGYTSGGTVSLTNDIETELAKI